jgi:hypothetical protein
VRDAIEPIAGPRLGRYDDSFEVRAFGDNLTRWGTPVLLIETGAWPDDNPDPHLVRLNFIAIVSALDALATGAVHAADPTRYDALPMNESGLSYWIIRGGNVLRGDGQPAFRADVSVSLSRRVRTVEGRRELWMSASIDDFGDLRTAGSLFTIDASGLLIAPAIEAAAAGSEIVLPAWTAERPSQQLVQPGSAANLMLLRPIAGDRYRVERVLQGEWRLGGP